ncbi:MAG: tyrosine-type recombinase/integrase [Bacteroidota bacterium]
MSDVTLRFSSSLPVPALIAQSDENTARRFVEFFTAQIRNKNTRQAYGRAVGQFLSWCGGRGLTLRAIEPVHVAAYIEQHPASTATVKQHLAAIRSLFDYLVTGQALPANPAHAVRGPKLSRDVGVTPVLSPDQARRLLAHPDPDRLVGVRDRAVIALMLYSFARVSAVCGLLVRDYFPQGKRWQVRLTEKGGKVRVLPVHHAAEAALDAWLAAAGIQREKKTPLFRKVDRQGRLTDEALTRRAVYKLIRTHAEAVGIDSVPIGAHSMRGTGITTYLENGGSLETAQRIAGHASIKTTRLYDRRDQRVQLSEIERVQF